MWEGNSQTDKGVHSVGSCGDVLSYRPHDHLNKVSTDEVRLFNCDHHVEQQWA